MCPLDQWNDLLSRAHTAANSHGVLENSVGNTHLFLRTGLGVRMEVRCYYIGGGAATHSHPCVTKAPPPLTSTTLHTRGIMRSLNARNAYEHDSNNIIGYHNIMLLDENCNQ